MHALAFLALFNVTIVSGSRAFVDISNYPEDWCRGVGSRPTRSTGECICLNRGCLGSRCRREMEFVYYVYSECPQCECASSSDNKDTEYKTNNDNGNGYVKTPLSKNTNAKKRYSTIINNNNYDNDNTNYDNDEKETILEFIEDNSRIIFATVVVLLLFLLVIPLFTKSKDELLSPQQNQNNEANDNEPKTLIKDPTQSNKND